MPLQDVELPLQGILSQMETSGIRLDSSILSRYAEEVEAQISEVT